MSSNDLSQLVGSCVKYEHDRETDCQNHGCFDENICRCSTITNIVIEEIDLQCLRDIIYSNLLPSDKKSSKRHLQISRVIYDFDLIDQYCIDRIIRHFEAYDHDSWHIDVVPGYYGEEIGEITLDSRKLLKIRECCQKVFDMDNTRDKINFTLQLEYGNILKSIEKSNYEINTISKDEIDFKKLNKDYLEILSTKDLHYYHNYDLPRGIVQKRGSKYVIIDGYNRITASKTDNIKIFLAT